MVVSQEGVLLTWLKNYYIIDLKIELLAINMNITNDSRHFRFFFGELESKNSYLCHVTKLMTSSGSFQKEKILLCI